jgi:hypothetical protein
VAAIADDLAEAGVPLARAHELLSGDVTGPTVAGPTAAEAAVSGPTAFAASGLSGGVRP